MKTLKVIAIALIAGSIFSSCVSSRKYDEAVNQKVDWENKYNVMSSQYQAAMADNEKLKASSSDAIAAKEKELNQKEMALKESQRKIDELKAAIRSEKDAIANLKQEVCSALKCFSPDELTVEVRDGKLYVSMSDKLLFPSGSDVVNKRGMEAIQMLAKVLDNSKLEIMVEGHTDAVPINTERNRDNWDLSVHRATSVTRIFVDNGITPSRIIACGRGEFHPVAANNTEENRQLNRRTEIVLAPKLDKLWKLTEETDNSTMGSVIIDK